VELSKIRWNCVKHQPEPIRKASAEVAHTLIASPPQWLHDFSPLCRVRPRPAPDDVAAAARTGGFLVMTSRSPATDRTPCRADDQRAATPRSRPRPRTSRARCRPARRIARLGFRSAERPSGSPTPSFEVQYAEAWVVEGVRRDTELRPGPRAWLIKSPGPNESGDSAAVPSAHPPRLTCGVWVLTVFPPPPPTRRWISRSGKPAPSRQPNRELPHVYSVRDSA
jgi:hypothetical protein